MKIMVEVELEVNIEGDRTNIEEVLEAVDGVSHELREKLTKGIVEGYQEGIVHVLCSASGSTAKHGLGGHQKKEANGARCRCRTFKRGGFWGEPRRVQGKNCEVSFRPRVIECEGCGKKLTPVLDALELEPYQRWTTGLLRKVMEAIADTSYRRGRHQLDVVGEVPVARSTMHRWAGSLEWPVGEAQGERLLSADGTGFKRWPGERGEVRIVLEIGENGQVRPLGVWAGSSWEEIGKQVKDRLKGQPQLFVGDGERGMEMWIGEIAEEVQRSHWHFVRDSRVMLWHDDVKGSEAKEVMRRISRLLAIEIPEGDIEEVSEVEKGELEESVGSAERKLLELQGEFEHKGYTKAAQYLESARERLFSHLRLWLRTGIIAPKTASIVENVIKELGRRLKKVGWNWSDEGATRMGRMIVLRRYDSESWANYWREKMNLQERCKIRIVRFETRRAA